MFATIGQWFGVSAKPVDAQGSASSHKSNPLAFDQTLDLTEVHSRLFICGLPTNGRTINDAKTRRNNVGELARQLDQRFGPRKYLVLNLAPDNERYEYDVVRFHSQVLNFKPALEDETNKLDEGLPLIDTDLYRVAYVIEFWLRWRPEHAVVLHDVDGKRRAAAAVSAYLTWRHQDQVGDALSAMNDVLRMRQRGEKDEPVRLPMTWRQLLLNFTTTVQGGSPAAPRRLLLARIFVEMYGEVQGHEGDVSLQVFEGPRCVWDSEADAVHEQSYLYSAGSMKASVDRYVAGDVVIMIYCRFRSYRHGGGSGSSGAVGGSLHDSAAPSGDRDDDDGGGDSGVLSEKRVLVRYAFHTNTMPPDAIPVSPKQVDIFGYRGRTMVDRHKFALNLLISQPEDEVAGPSGASGGSGASAPPSQWPLLSPAMISSGSGDGDGFPSPAHSLPGPSGPQCTLAKGEKDLDFAQVLNLAPRGLHAVLAGLVHVTAAHAVWPDNADVEALVREGNAINYTFAAVALQLGERDLDRARRLLSSSYLRALSSAFVNVRPSTFTAIFAEVFPTPPPQLHALEGGPVPEARLLTDTPKAADADKHELVSDKRLVTATTSSSAAAGKIEGAVIVDDGGAVAGTRPATVPAAAFPSGATQSTASASPTGLSGSPHHSERGSSIIDELTIPVISTAMAAKLVSGAARRRANTMPTGPLPWAVATPGQKGGSTTALMTPVPVPPPVETVAQSMALLASPDTRLSATDARLQLHMHEEAQRFLDDAVGRLVPLLERALAARTPSPQPTAEGGGAVGTRGGAARDDGDLVIVSSSAAGSGGSVIRSGPGRPAAASSYAGAEELDPDAFGFQAYEGSTGAPVPRLSSAPPLSASRPAIRSMASLRESDLRPVIAAIQASPDPSLYLAGLQLAAAAKLAEKNVLAGSALRTAAAAAAAADVVGAVRALALGAAAAPLGAPAVAAAAAGSSGVGGGVDPSQWRDSLAHLDVFQVADLLDALVQLGATADTLQRQQQPSGATAGPGGSAATSAGGRGAGPSSSSSGSKRDRMDLASLTSALTAARQPAATHGGGTGGGGVGGDALGAPSSSIAAAAPGTPGGVAGRPAGPSQPSQPATPAGQSSQHPRQPSSAGVGSHAPSASSSSSSWWLGNMLTSAFTVNSSLPPIPAGGAAAAAAAAAASSSSSGGGMSDAVLVGLTDSAAPFLPTDSDAAERQRAASVQTIATILSADPALQPLLQVLVREVEPYMLIASRARGGSSTGAGHGDSDGHPSGSWGVISPGGTVTDVTAGASDGGAAGGGSGDPDSGPSSAGGAAGRASIGAMLSRQRKGSDSAGRVSSTRGLLAPSGVAAASPAAGGQLMSPAGGDVPAGALGTIPVGAALAHVAGGRDLLAASSSSSEGPHAQASGVHPPSAPAEEAIKPAAEPAAAQPSATAAETPALASGVPDLSKYHRMLKQGVPRGAVQHRMTMDGLDPALLDGAPPSAPEPAPAPAGAPDISKYLQMLKQGVPRGAVQQRMMLDGLDPALLDGAPAEPAQAPATAEAPPAPTVPSDVDLGKYERMLRMGVPPGAVRAKMTQDGVDAGLLNGVLVAMGRPHDVEAPAPPPAPAGPPKPSREEAAKAKADAAAVARVQRIASLRAAQAQLAADAATPLRSHPVYGRFAEMLRLGVSPDAVAAKMAAAGLEPAVVLKGDPELPPSGVPALQLLKDDETYGRFFRMLRVGLPRDTVSHKMRMENVADIALELDPDLPVPPGLADKPPEGDEDGDGAPPAAAAVRKPKKQRKRLHWEAISADRLVGGGTIWDEMASNSGPGGSDETGAATPDASSSLSLAFVDDLIDEEELDRLFTQDPSAAPLRKKQPGAGGGDGGTGKVIYLTSDMKRERNVGIGLGRLRMPFDVVRHCLASLSCYGPGGEELTQEHLSLLEDLLPAPDSEEAARAKAFRGDRARLSEASRFWATVADVPKARSRAAALAYQRSFDGRLKELAARVELLRRAVGQVRNSPRLKRLLLAVRHLGNKLNADEGASGGGGAGGHAGAASPSAIVGFRLETLLKLSQTKAFDGKTTVLRFLVANFLRKDPDALRVSDDFPDVPDAARLTLESLKSDVGSLRTGLQGVERLVREQALTAAPGQDTVGWGRLSARLDGAAIAAAAKAAARGAMSETAGPTVSSSSGSSSGPSSAESAATAPAAVSGGPGGVHADGSGGRPASTTSAGAAARHGHSLSDSAAVLGATARGGESTGPASPGSLSPLLTSVAPAGESLVDFVGRAQSRLVAIAGDEESARSAFSQLLAYLGEDPTTSPEGCFSTLAQFVAGVRAAKRELEEEETRREREARTRAQSEMRRRGPGTGPAPPALGATRSLSSTTLLGSPPLATPTLNGAIPPGGIAALATAAHPARSSGELDAAALPLRRLDFDATLPATPSAHASVANPLDGPASVLGGSSSTSDSVESEVPATMAAPTTPMGLQTSDFDDSIDGTPRATPLDMPATPGGPRPPRPGIHTPSARPPGPGAALMMMSPRPPSMAPPSAPGGGPPRPPSGPPPRPAISLSSGSGGMASVLAAIQARRAAAGGVDEE